MSLKLHVPFYRNVSNEKFYRKISIIWSRCGIVNFIIGSGFIFMTCIFRKKICLFGLRSMSDCIDILLKDKRIYEVALLWVCLVLNIFWIPPFYIQIEGQRIFYITKCYMVRYDMLYYFWSQKIPTEQRINRIWTRSSNEHTKLLKLAKKLGTR